MAERISYQEVYKVLDPIIKERPKIDYKKLSEDHKEIADSISYGAFLARKKKLLGAEGYTYPRRKKRSAKRTKIGPIDLELVSSVTSKMDLSDKAILKFIKRILPNSKRKDEYKDLFKVIVDQPRTTHSDLKRLGLVTISDPCYYAFRRKVLEFINEHKESNDKSKTKSSKSEVPEVSELSKVGAIFRTIHVNKGASEDMVNEAKEIVKSIREEKGVLIEVEELKTGYVIVEFSR